MQLVVDAVEDVDNYYVNYEVKVMVMVGETKLV
jgi:hypothetical protein